MEGISLEQLPEDIAGARKDEMNGPVRLQGLQEAMRAFERKYLIRVLNATEGKKGKAAELLGISRKNLWEKLKNHGVTATIGA